MVKLPKFKFMEIDYNIDCEVIEWNRQKPKRKKPLLKLP